MFTVQYLWQPIFLETVSMETKSLVTVTFPEQCLSSKLSQQTLSKIQPWWSKTIFFLTWWEQVSLLNLEDHSFPYLTSGIEGNKYVNL